MATKTPTSDGITVPMATLSATAFVVGIIGLVCRDRKYASNEYMNLYIATIVFCFLQGSLSAQLPTWMFWILTLATLILGSVLLSLCMPEK
jgi:uncharacterized membrane protein